MIVQQIASSGNDEFYTPEYAIKPIMKYLPPPSDNLVPIWHRRKFVCEAIQEQRI